MKRKNSFHATILGLVMVLGTMSAVAQTNSYQQNNLVSDMAGAAAHTDPKLINPWGISFVPGQPFWVSDNNSGYSTIYDANGVQQFSVLIPAPPGDTSPATPTGTVINQTGGFKVGGIASQFLFVTEDGTISGWNGTGNAILALDNSAAGAVYKGMAILSPACCAPFLVAANFHSGLIEAYSQSFQPLAPPGSFTDPQLPAGYAPFNIQQVGSFVFVTYAVQDSAKHDPVNAAGNGIVNIFNLEGNFVGRFASNGALNSPWGVVQASANFGQFSNDILIGNFGDGTINAFDPATGNSLGQMKDQTGATITNASLWALVFGAGGTGDANTLYFTAGLADEGHGLFGAITAATAATLDYSLTATPQNATVAAGGSKTFTLTVTPANGFDSTVTLSCVAPTGVTCTLNPTTVTPGGGAATSMLTVTTSTSVQHYGRLMGTLLVGIGLFGCFFVEVRRSRRGLYSLLLAGFASTLIAGSLLASTGCGSGSSSQTNRGTASIVVTATSGALSHTTTINLTVQ